MSAHWSRGKLPSKFLILIKIVTINHRTLQSNSSHSRYLYTNINLSWNFFLIYFPLKSVWGTAKWLFFFQRNSKSAPHRSDHVIGPFIFDDTLTTLCNISGMTHYFCVDRYTCSFFRESKNIAETTKMLCEQNTSSLFMAKKRNCIPVSSYRKERGGWFADVR